MVLPSAASLVPGGAIPTGAGPIDVATGPDGRVFVANLNGSSISVYDPRTYETATFHCRSHPFRIAVSPDGGLLYVVNGVGSEPKTLELIRTDDFGSTGSIPLANYDGGDIALNAVGTRLYVGTTVGVTVINTFAQTVVAQLVISGQVSGIALTPDGSRLYVGCYDARSVAIIDTESNSVSKVFPVGAAPSTGMVITRDGRRAYVPTYVAPLDSTSVLVVDTDPASATVDTVVGTVTVDVAPADVAVSPDGSVVYVVSLRSGTVSVLDSATGSVISRHALGSPNPYALAVSSDGAAVYVASPEDDQVKILLVRPPAVYDIVDTITVPSDPLLLAVNRADESLWIASFDSYLSFLDTDRHVTNYGGELDRGVFDLAFTPDAKFAYVVEYTGPVRVFDTVTRKPVAAIPIPGGGTVDFVELSPDGRLAYLVHESNAPHTLSVIDTATRTVTRSVHLDVSAGSLAVAPDGTALYLVNSHDGSIVRIDAATLKIVTVFPLGDASVFVTVSPDGKTLYTVAWPPPVGGVPSRGKVRIVDVATGTVTDVPLNGFEPFNPVLNADGTRLYVAQSGFKSVAVVDTTAKRLISIVNVGGNPRGLAISPGGEHLYVSNYDDDSISVLKIA